MQSIAPNINTEEAVIAFCYLDPYSFQVRYLARGRAQSTERRAQSTEHRAQNGMSFNDGYDLILSSARRALRPVPR